MLCCGDCQLKQRRKTGQGGSEASGRKGCVIKCKPFPKNPNTKAFVRPLLRSGGIWSWQRWRLMRWRLVLIEKRAPGRRTSPARTGGLRLPGGPGAKGWLDRSMLSRGLLWVTWLGHHGAGRFSHKKNQIPAICTNRRGRRPVPAPPRCRVPGAFQPKSLRRPARSWHS